MNLKILVKKMNNKSSGDNDEYCLIEFKKLLS